MSNKKLSPITLYIFIIIIMVLLVSMLNTILNVIDHSNEKNENNIEQAKNLTMKQLTSNMSLVEKQKIITFNCESYVGAGIGWTDVCKKELSEEILK